MAINSVPSGTVTAQIQPVQPTPRGPNVVTPQGVGAPNNSQADRASLFFDRFVQAWEKSQKHSEAITKTLPASVRPLIETQLIVSKLDLQAQLFTRVADVATSTVRKMQQMGGGS